MSLSRRALLAGGAAVALAGGGLWWHAAQTARAESPGTLVSLARALFPHRFLSDARYAAIVDGWMRSLPESDRAALPKAIAALGPDPTRPEAINAALKQPLWLGFRAAVLIGLYSDLALTRRFGYQGPSFAEGGYLHRGFDDIAWLPKPPVAGPEPWLN